jgi:hypothetical protein
LSALPNYFGIVLIVKNEAKYIFEWIEYYLYQGAAKIYIFDNESGDELRGLLSSYIDEGVVVYKYWPGIYQQIPAYEWALNAYRDDCAWLAFIDIDEFIVPLKKRKIIDILKEHENISGVEINWVMYGSSGKKNYEEGLVMERFKDHSKTEFDPNRLFKTIFNPRLVYKIGVHAQEYWFRKRPVDTDWNTANHGKKGWKPVYGEMRINHYYVKSLEEFIQKNLRGEVKKTEDNKYSPEAFAIYDRNEVENDTIMDSFISVINGRIRERKEYTLKSGVQKDVL